KSRTMKLFSTSSFFFLVIGSCTAFAASGCSGDTLNGGSNTSGGASSSGSSSGTSGTLGSAGAGADSPLSGQIAGKPFAPVSTYLELQKENGEWFLSLTNYTSDCGRVDPTTAPTEAERMVITIGRVTPAAGTDTIVSGDLHGATFQVGVYQAGGPDPV